MSRANDWHVTHPKSSQDAAWAEHCRHIDQFVETHYGHVMPPYQRELVKRIAKGEQPNYARPFIRRVCENTAREVVQAISADQGAE